MTSIYFCLQQTAWVEIALVTLLACLTPAAPETNEKGWGSGSDHNFDQIESKILKFEMQFAKPTRTVVRR